MLGYRLGDNNNGASLNKFSYGVAGASSGVFTRLTAQPLDVLKIRFQLQVEPISSSRASPTTPLGKYRGLVQAARCITAEEGLGAFWKGHVPAQGLSIIYGVVQFMSFEMSSKQLQLWLPASLNTVSTLPYQHFLCGAVAGCGATVAAHPFDVIRTRFVAQGNDKAYTSIINAITKMLTKEGPSSMYRGLYPTLLQIAPQNGLTFMFYTTLQTTAIRIVPNKDSVVNLMCGSMAGTAAKVIVYPLDMVKKRLQVNGFDKSRVGFGETAQYSGALNCIRTVVRREGPTALFKGLQVSVLKAAIVSGVSFWAYEACCNTLLTLDFVS